MPETEIVNDPPVLTSLDQVTAEWLSETLRRQGGLERGEVVAVERSWPHPKEAERFAYLKLTYSAEAVGLAPARLFVKLSRQVVPGGLPYTGQEEADFYNRVAPAMPNPPIARCYDAVYSPDHNRAHFLLEDPSHTHLIESLSQLPPTRFQAEQIVDALAQIQAFWWGHPRLGRDIGKLPTAERPQRFGAWAERILPRWLDFLGDRLPVLRRQIYLEASEALPTLLTRRTVGSPALTVVHGDLHIGNCFYPRNPSKDHLRIFDWEDWKVDLGLTDLAGLLALMWFPERRARMELELVQRYHRRLIEGGVKGYDWQACWFDYRLAVIIMLFAPVGQWNMGLPTDQWWNHLERITLAYQDLRCRELLDL